MSQGSGENRTPCHSRSPDAVRRGVLRHCCTHPLQYDRTRGSAFAFDASTLRRRDAVPPPEFGSEPGMKSFVPVVRRANLAAATCGYAPMRIIFRRTPVLRFSSPRVSQQAERKLAGALFLTVIHHFGSSIIHLGSSCRRRNPNEFPSAYH
jgi:hypothetical protein